jgi:hypothetical protein
MVTWGATAAVVGVIAAVVVIVALDGSEAEPASVFLECTVSDSDAATVLTPEGMVTEKEAEEGCNGIAAELSDEGRYWRVGLPPTPSSYPELVCGLNAPEGQNGTAMVEVDSESFTSSATAICGELAHEGWTQFTHGGVVGPWQHEYQIEEEAEEEAERLEQRLLEEEQLELEEVEEAVFACEERVEAEEEAELEALQRGTEEQVAAAESESEEFRLEEEGWEAEEEVWAWSEEAAAECQENSGSAEAEGGTEYR